MNWWVDLWRSLNAFERVAACSITVATMIAVVLIFTTAAPAAEPDQQSANYTAVLLALIVAIPALLSAPILSLMTTRSAAKARVQESIVRHQERLEDWERQDKVAADARAEAKHQSDLVAAAADAAKAVAAKADEAARLLIKNQKESDVKNVEQARLLAESNAKIAAEVAISSSRLESKVDVVHTLVNSTMTRAMQSELDAIKREVLMMLEVVELKKRAGSEPSPETLEAIELTRSKIHEKEVALADRLKASNKVIEQIKDLSEVKNPSNAVAGSDAAASAYRDIGTLHEHPSETGPLPVVDKRNADNTERTAVATEELASAAKRTAVATEQSAVSDKRTADATEKKS